MLTLKTKETFDSKTVAGVRFTLRVLNNIQRAQRDLQVSEQLATYYEKVRRQGRLIQKATASVPQLPPDPKEEQIAERRAALEGALANSPDAEEIQRLDDEANRIYLSTIVPNAIRSAFISIEGIEVDGRPATIDELLTAAPGYLLEEIGSAAEAVSGLTPEEQKNSASPTTSAG